MHRILYSILFCCFAQSASAQCNAIITPGGPTTFCDGNSVALTGSLGDTYQWYLNANSIPGATNATYTADVAGSYTVETDSAGCVSMSAPVVVTVNTVPAQPGAISGNDTICSDAMETYTVSPVPGATSYVWYKYSYPYQTEFSDTTSGPTVTGALNRSGSSNSPASILSVRSRNECGVSDTSEFHLAIYTPVTVGGTIQPWNLDITNTGMGYCVEYEPPYTELYASWHSGQGYSLATTFEWYRNGVLMPGEVGQRATITRGGNYSVKVRCGPCSTTLNKGLVKQCLPRITIYPQDSINTCLDSNVMLTVVLDNDGYSGPVYTWRWYLNGTYIQGSDNAYSITPVGSGVYSVGIGASECQQGFGSYGCSMPKNRPRSLYVTMPPVLTVTQTDDTLFATPGYDTYQWFESGMPLPGEANQKLVLSVDGFYTVEGIFMNGCVESSNPFDSDFMPPPPPEPPAPPPGTNPQEELAEQMTVSPNPVSGSFVLKTKVAKEDTRATISITDATGSSMFEKEIDVVDGIVEEKIELGNAPALMGIIRLRSAHTLKTTKFFRK